MRDDELRRTLVLANAFKEGDLVLGGTGDDRLRAEARTALSATTLGELRRTTLVDDGVTAALTASRDRRHDAELDALTIGAIKAILLSPHTSRWIGAYGDALGSEAIAAVVKVMTDDELSVVARAITCPLGDGPVAIGGPGHFGSRIQPNSVGDDEDEILFSILEGLVYGCGDVIIGLNPAADDVDAIVRLEQLLESVVRRLDLPTRYCVLSDIVKQDAARGRCRVDVGFQSLAGTSRALAGMVGLDVEGIAGLARGFAGLYFETGQGSEVTNGAADAIDMVTLEARTYGVARHVRHRLSGPGRPAGTGRSAPWMIVNDVAGFIGPEVFRSGAQLERACLEDTVMARLHGLTMGLDVCATFHMGIAPRELRDLTSRIAMRAAPAYLMAVAGNADPMLGYLTTSFRQHPHLRRRTGTRLTSPMEARLETLGVLPRPGEPSPDEALRPGSGQATIARLYTAWRQAGGDRRSSTSLEGEARTRLATLRDRGLDLGANSPEAADVRLDGIYRHARTALYAALDEGVLREATVNAMRVRTMAMDRDHYLAHPDRGEQLASGDAGRVRRIDRGDGSRIQIVVSDGLNANAINEQLRSLLPPLRHRLHAGGASVRATDVVVQNGRVRAGYEIGALVGAEVLVHLIGERPGTGLNSVSAYLTYGRDAAGQLRWARSLDHSATTAVCGIHPRGKTPDAAVDEIARVVARMLEERRSGVALGSLRS